MFQKFFSIILLFCLLFSANGFSQKRYLKVKGINKEENKIIDSLSYKKTHVDYASIEAELIKLKQQLDKIGFLESKIKSLKKENDSTHLAEFELKQQYTYIKVYHNNEINDKILAKITQDYNTQYFVLEIKNLEKQLQFLNSEIANQGDPFSTLQLKDIKKDSKGNLTASLFAKENKQRKIDKVIVKGYEKFPRSFTKRFLKIKPNQVFNLKKIKEKTNNLNNIQFANQIKEPEVLFTKDSTILYLYIEKQKSNVFDGFLGFGTNEQTNKIEFDGYLNLNLTNNLNYGESFRLNYKSDENEQKTFNVQAKLPYIFQSPIGLELELNIFKKDSTFATVTQTAKLGYQIDLKNKVSIGVNSISSSDLLNQNTNTLNDYKANQFLINYNHIYRQLDDKLFPVNFQFDFILGLGNRTQNNFKVSQSTLTLNSFKIFNLNNRNSIYLGLNGSVLNSDDYLDNELFRFGGINSIRGFEENSLTANLYTVVNTEYRYRLSNNLYIHSVVDAAYFENKNLQFKGKLYGFGFGFGIQTNAGLFKLNYSSGKTENQKFKFSDSKIHISLTTNF